MRRLGVIGPLSRDIVAGADPQIGGGPWHAARALRALGREAVVLAKCGGDDLLGHRRTLATLGLPSNVSVGGETTAFSFSYDEHGVRTMQVDAIGEPWRREDVPDTLLTRVEWLHVAPLLRGDFDADMLEWLARGRHILLDAQGLVRARKTGPLVLDDVFDRSLLRHVRVLKVAEEEAEAIGGVDELDVPEIVVTSGPRGSRVITRDLDVHVPAHWVAADPTGAGDAYAIAYAGARSEGHAPLSAARRATALVAALLTQGPRR
jgi:sugar/nucleoside kinase (ribokinase family)